jgi:hypothetical protein
MNITIVTWEIVRETSQYNHHIRWFYRTYREDGTPIGSMGYRTRREAEEDHARSVAKGLAGFPIGDRLFFTEFVERAF